MNERDEVVRTVKDREASWPAKRWLDMSSVRR